MLFKIDKQIIFHLIIICIVSLGLWTAQSLPYEGGVFPRAVTKIVLLAALISLFIECYKKKNIENKKIEQKPIKLGNERNIMINFTWLIGYAICIWLFGFIFASTLFVFSYIKFRGRVSWSISMLLALGSFTFLEVIFVILLKIRMLPGALWNWLNL